MHTAVFLKVKYSYVDCQQKVDQKQSHIPQLSSVAIMYYPLEKFLRLRNPNRNVLTGCATVWCKEMLL